MSIECRECEHDLRDGHDALCSHATKATRLKEICRLREALITLGVVRDARDTWKSRAKKAEEKAEKLLRNLQETNRAYSKLLAAEDRTAQKLINCGAELDELHRLIRELFAHYPVGTYKAMLVAAKKHIEKLQESAFENQCRCGGNIEIDTLQCDDCAATYYPRELR